MNLYELIKNNSNGKGDGVMWNSVEMISKFIDEHFSEEQKEKLMADVFCLMSDGHFDEYFAEKAIKKMYYQDKGGRKHYAPYWTDDQVEDIYDSIKSRIPNYNLYDFMVTFNMIASDNWCLLHDWYQEITPDMMAKKVTDMALNWLDDNDWPTKSKIWDYLNK